MCVTNDLRIDQRVDRIANSLIGAGYDVLVVGRHKGLFKRYPLSGRNYRTWRMRLLFSRGKFFYAEYNYRLFWFLIFHRFDIVNANDLDSLAGAWYASRLKGKDIVYDSHEYFTEVPELQDGSFAKKVWLKVERRIFPQLSKAYTVCKSIADIYTEKYGVEVGVIRNLPLRKGKSITSESREVPVIIYQGTLNIGRGIELMIRSMKHLENVQLWIVGVGPVQEKLTVMIHEEGVADKVTLKGFVPFDKLAAITAQATIGLSLEEDMGLNYRYALPNKLFDYLNAGIPVMVSDLPEMRRIVQDFEVGEVLSFDERTPEELASRLGGMLKDRFAMQKWSENAERASNELNWEQESLTLQQYYPALAGRSYDQ